MTVSRGSPDSSTLKIVLGTGVGSRGGEQPKSKLVVNKGDYSSRGDPPSVYSRKPFNPQNLSKKTT